MNSTISKKLRPYLSDPRYADDVMTIAETALDARLRNALQAPGSDKVTGHTKE